MKIYHLKHNQINQELWDRTIDNALNQFGYAYSWYLNIVSPNWEALVLNDYEYVMPLTVKRKYKISYVVQPEHSQQLGIFSEKQISSETVKLFIENLPYTSYQINMNESNPMQFEKSLKIKHPNFTIDLQNSYENLVLLFSNNTNRNINKAIKNNLVFDYISSVDVFINFYHTINSGVTNFQIKLLTSLILKGIEHEKIKIPVIRNEKHQILASCCLLTTGRRIIYLVPVSSAEGKSFSAMFMLINNIIRDNAEKEIILDFEGSKIEGIARFYKGFGAINNPYHIIKKLRPNFLIGRI